MAKRIRIFTIVKCKDCNKEWNKRCDTLKEWKGRCKSCTSIEIASRPEQKAILRQNGLAYIAKYGNIKSPKMENRGRGETHFNWKGGITPFRTALWQSLEYKYWRKSVFERDGYKCVICNASTHNLQADHIMPFALYPDLRLDISNGRTLCIPCHIQYGARVFNGKITRHSSNGTNWTAQ